MGFFDKKPKIKKLIIKIGVVISLTLFTVMGIQYCEEKREDERFEKEKNERIRKIKDAENRFRSIITYEYMVDYSKEVLSPHFERIDSIHFWHTSSDSFVKEVLFDPSKKEYYTIIDVLGQVIGGKSYYSDKRNFKFSIVDTLYESKINTYEARHQKIKITDWDDNKIYPLETDFSELRKKEEEKKREEIRKNSSTNFNIDGVSVNFRNVDGNSFVFETSKSLEPKQIVNAIKRIGNGNMVQFYKGNNHYADYVYSTQCIIYKNTGTIYKVVDGIPVRAN